MQRRSPDQVNFEVSEQDSASGNKRYLAWRLPEQRLRGIIVIWVWCMLHQYHLMVLSLIVILDDFEWTECDYGNKKYFNGQNTFMYLFLETI